MKQTCAIPPHLLKTSKETLFEEIEKNPTLFLENRDYYPLLFEKNENGITGAHLLAQMGVKQLLSHKELWSIPDSFGEPVAFYMVKKGLWSLSPAFLSVRNASGKTVAHEIARINPYLIYENAPFSLKWRDNRGWTVAHELAKSGIKFKISDPVVKVKTDDGVSVFSVMMYHLTKEELKKIPSEFFEEKIGDIPLAHYLAKKLILPKEKALLKDKEGKTALFVYLYTAYARNSVCEEKIEELLPYVKKDKLSLTFLAEKGFFSEKKHKSILKMILDENTGTTVAHVEAASGKNFFSKELLTLTDKYGWSVAHVQAARGEKRHSLKIKIFNNEGDTPAHVYVKKGFPIFEDDVFFYKDVKGIPAWAYSPAPPDYFLKRTDRGLLKKLLSLKVPAEKKIIEYLTKDSRPIFFNV